MTEIARLREENEQLARRLAEAEEALRAIGQGQVDAIVVDAGEGGQIFSLSGAERIYRLLVETMREAALTVAPDGTILFCNEQFCRLVKVSSSQVLGRSLTQFVPSEDEQQTRDLLEEVSSQPVQRRLVLVDGQGLEVPVQVAASLLQADDMTSICIVAADLTELEASAASIRDLREHQRAMQAVETQLRKSQSAALNLMEDAIMARQEAERAAAESWRSRERLSLASSAAELGVFEWDMERDVASWENDRMYAILGRSPADGPLGLREARERLLVGDAAPAAQRDLEREAGASGSVHEIFPIRRLDDGRERWLELSGRIEVSRGESGPRLLGVLADITERKVEAEAAAWRSRRDDLLSRTAARLLEIRDPLGLVQELCREVMAFLDCHAFFNYVVEGGGRSTLRLNAYAGIPAEQAALMSPLEQGVAVCGCVARDGERIIAENIQTEDDPRTVLVKGHGIQAYCCHPLLVQGRTIGTLSFGTRTRPRFAPEEVEVMMSVANLVTLAMNRLEMERQLQTSEERYRALFQEHDRLYRQQLDIAQTLQSALIHLPAEVGPARIKHLYRSATETARVGGDFYDAFPAKNGRIVVLIGDVSGHGVEAARMANLTKDVIRAFAGVTFKPNDVLARTNRLLLQDDFGGFVTVFLGIIDMNRGTMRYASAGHPDVFLRRRSGELLLLRGYSVPLGVDPDALWISRRVDVGPGDMLFLYTDGVTEARRDQQMFGDDRLRALVETETIAFDALPQAVLDSVLEFSGETLRDDLAIMAVSLAGAAPEEGTTGQDFAQQSFVE